ncbi:unnamed protein product [Rangifer tarandus platyrhynchus]|uniref:Uncharacterized protein n=1 Tax=Rangifer tarandus platyrhynchus TaxID=3082113 RepID=A0AC59YIF4_RANTA
MVPRGAVPKIALDGGLQLSVPSALLGSPVAVAVSCPLSTCLERPSSAACACASVASACSPGPSPRVLPGWRSSSRPLPAGLVTVAGPSLPCLGGGQLSHTHPWQQMHGACPGVVDTPPADPWIEFSYCGDPVFVHDCGADELGELGAVSQTGPPLRAGLGPGCLRQRALAAGQIPGAAGQLPDLPLRAPLGQPQAPNRLSLSVGSPLPPWGLGTIMGFIPRILRRLFKPQTALLSAMQQCPGLCLQP